MLRAGELQDAGTAPARGSASIPALLGESHYAGQQAGVSSCTRSEEPRGGRGTEAQSVHRAYLPGRGHGGKEEDKKKGRRE